MTNAAVRWIDSTSWELPFFGLPTHIPWPEEVEAAVADQDPFEVEHLLTAIERLGPEAGEPWLSFSRASTTFDDLAEALEDSEIPRAAELLSELETILPGTAFGMYHRAYVARHEGRDDDAIRLYQQALEKAPAIPVIWNNLGALLAAHGMKEEAVAAFRKTLELAPNDPMALEGLASLRVVVKLQAQGGGPEQQGGFAYVDIPTFRNMVVQQIDQLAANPDQLLGFAEQLLRDGLIPDVGLLALERAAALRPEHSRTLLALGAAYRLSGQHDKARETLTRHTQIHPQDPDGFMHLAQACSAAGDAEGERAAIERVLELEPNHHAALGIRFGLKAGEHDPAREDELARYGEQRGAWMAYLFASSIARERGDTPAALRQAERAFALGPEREEVLVHYAATLGDSKELGKLAQLIKPAVESGRYSKRLDWNYAQVLRELGLSNDAISVLTRAAANANDEFKGMVATTIDGWTGLVTGCGVPLEIHSAGFLARPVVISLADGDGGIILNAGAQLPATGAFPWRATGEETLVALHQGQTGSSREPRDLGIFRIRGVRPAVEGPTTIQCEVAAQADGAIHFRATQNGRKLPVGWMPQTGRK